MDLKSILAILKYFKRQTEDMSIYKMKKHGQYLISHKMMKSNIQIKRQILKIGISFLNKTK